MLLSPQQRAEQCPDGRPYAERQQANDDQRSERAVPTSRQFRRRIDRQRPGELAISVIRPTTKYENKAQDAGSTVTELVWESRSERNRP
jgi:tRNA (guanine-N7-)-methyltransferase